MPSTPRFSAYQPSYETSFTITSSRATTICLISTGERLLCSGSFLRKDLALLLTSRQLHAEAALHPYKLGFFDFRFDEPAFYEDEWHEGVVQRFLQARSRKQIGALARMEVSTHNMYGTSSDKTQNGVDWVMEMCVW